MAGQEEADGVVFAAKFFGVRVLVYSFGFGKRIAGFRRGDTDYRLSLIPLGGYVRMAGDMPEERITISPHAIAMTPLGEAGDAPQTGHAANLPMGAAPGRQTAVRWRASVRISERMRSRRGSRSVST